MSGYQSVIGCLECFQGIEENYRQIDVLCTQLHSVAFRDYAPNEDLTRPPPPRLTTTSLA